MNNTEVLKAAGRAGYREMVTIEDENQIDSDSFLTEPDAETYVSNITGKQILVVRLDGMSEDVHQEPSITSALPAIDKQADLYALTESTEQEHAFDIGDMTEWLLTALRKDQGIRIVSLDQMEKEPSAAYMQTLMKEDQNQAVVYRYSLTDQSLAALCISDPVNRDVYEKVRELLGKYRVTATFFVDAAVPSTLVRQIIADGYDVQINGQSSETNENTKALLDSIQSERERLASFGQKASICLAGKENLKAVRKACFFAGLCPVMPQNPSELSAGSYYLYCADNISAIEEFLEQARNQM